MKRISLNKFYRDEHLQRYVREVNGVEQRITKDDLDKNKHRIKGSSVPRDIVKTVGPAKPVRLPFPDPAEGRCMVEIYRIATGQLPGQDARRLTMDDYLKAEKMIKEQAVKHPMFPRKVLMDHIASVRSRLIRGIKIPGVAS